MPPEQWPRKRLGEMEGDGVTTRPSQNALAFGERLLELETTEEVGGFVTQQPVILLDLDATHQELHLMEEAGCGNSRDHSLRDL
ncbi:hypothetical protein D9613_006542 [Agrocybe pediades]|uniref:Uncharacterized protein n=1 Tax=Agrocybe pediades TaxID=84607 RepID=A0A8H4QHB7_9AGAR|nr:hypothetical protein D9613_006542 [Agrocybe pediades]